MPTKEKADSYLSELVEEENTFAATAAAAEPEQKQLDLTADSEEFDEMSIQLNPDAKEFVPVSPTRTVPLNSIIAGFMDPVVAQSPMKGDNPFMEDNITLPSELDFDHEAEVRPHELEEQSTDFMNLKEAMQQDDKLEQEYKDEALIFQEEVKEQVENYNEKESSFIEYSNGFQNDIDNAMNRSFYEGREGDELITENLNSGAGDFLNKLQPIPTFEDEDVDNKENLITNGSEPTYNMVESSEFFEPEKFVEEIKRANGDVDKYTDQELSPTIEISPPVVEQQPMVVDEIKEPEPVSSDPPSENTVQEQIPAPEVVDVIPVVIEAAPVAKAIAEEPKVEKKTATPAAKKTPLKPAASPSVKSSPALTKTSLASKSPAAAKSPAVSKIDSKTSAKSPAAAPVQQKPAPIRRPTTTSTTSTAPKPAAVAAPAPAKPKPTTTTTTAVRKVASATSSTAAPKTTTLLKKTTTTTTSAAPK